LTYVITEVISEVRCLRRTPKSPQWTGTARQWTLDAVQQPPIAARGIIYATMTSNRPWPSDLHVQRTWICSLQCSHDRCKWLVKSNANRWSGEWQRVDLGARL